MSVITAPSLRLDLAEDRQHLQATVAAVRPILLVLDPFVRLHRIDENASSDVAPRSRTYVTCSAASPWLPHAHGLGLSGARRAHRAKPRAQDRWRPSARLVGGRFP
jgi:hypothetical protein